MTPQLALGPAVVVTLVGFVGANLRTILLSLTRSKRLSDHPCLGLAKRRVLHGADAVGPEKHQYRDVERGPAEWHQYLAAVSGSHPPENEIHLAKASLDHLRSLGL